MSGKRFDILTRTSLENEYVLVELKSPKDDVFDIKSSVNKNGGKSMKYALSSSLSRAIPQVLNYKRSFESKKADDEDIARIGFSAGKISKCIIVIGTRKDDDSIWSTNFLNLKQSFSSVLEIWTYSDLISKLDITIKNLEDNLS